ncbi:hypothetical protein [Acidithiobacillus thiooxidans]|nr:hypothetical protein [Acidithiobacillus thiooxidans]
MTAHSTNQDWLCPACGRSIAACTYTRAGKPYFKTCQHHDHGTDYGRPARFVPTIICKACNDFDGMLKKVMGLPIDFSYSPAEIRQIITHSVSDTGRHLYYSPEVAVKIFRTSYRPGSSLPATNAMPVLLLLPVISRVQTPSHETYQQHLRAVEQMSKPKDDHHKHYLTACSMRASGYHLLETLEVYESGSVELHHSDAVISAFDTGGLTTLSIYKWISGAISLVSDKAA